MTKKKTDAATISLSGKELFLVLYGWAVVLIECVVLAIVAFGSQTSGKMGLFLVILALSTTLFLPLVFYSASYKTTRAYGAIARKLHLLSVAEVLLWLTVAIFRQ